MSYIISMRMIKENEINRVVTNTRGPNMANVTFNLSISSGTIVLLNAKGKSVSIMLKADVLIDNAVRQADGGFTYTVGNREYYVSAGTCTFKENKAVAYDLRHKKGLITFIA